MHGCAACVGVGVGIRACAGTHVHLHVWARYLKPQSSRSQAEKGTGSSVPSEILAAQARSGRGCRKRHRGVKRLLGRLIYDCLMMEKMRERASHETTPPHTQSFCFSCSNQAQKNVCLADKKSMPTPIHVAAAPGRPFISKGRTENRPGCLVPASPPSPAGPAPGADSQRLGSDEVDTDRHSQPAAMLLR